MKTERDWGDLMRSPDAASAELERVRVALAAHYAIERELGSAVIVA